MRALLRRQGVLYFGPKKSSARFDTGEPSTQEGKTQGKTSVTADPLQKVAVKNCVIDSIRLQSYKEVCRNKSKDIIPICYLESMFMRLIVMLATSSECLVSPLGLIHLKQTITQHQPINHLLDSAFDLQAHIVQYNQVEKGVEVEIKLEVIDKEGICVWEGLVTLLSRNSKAQKSGVLKSENRKSDKSVGGMSSSYPVKIEASFKRPLFMPGRAVIQHGKQEVSDGTATWVRVTEKESGAPHVVGTVMRPSRKS